MDTKNGIQNVHELIAQYQHELMDTYRRQHRLDDERLDKEYPLPNIEHDRQVIAQTHPQIATPAPPDISTAAVPEQPSSPPPSEQPAPPPQAETPSPPSETSPYIGYLQVYVYTGSTAEPIEGAQVIVSSDSGDNPTLFASALTDRSGLTPVIPLVSVDPMISMSPETAQAAIPYVAYDIQVSADGFSPVRYENVPIYGGNSVTQPAAMLPLIAGENGDVPRVYRSGGPTNLT